MIQQKNWLRQHIPQFTAALLLIQPVMDVISFWLQRFGLSTAPTLVLRMGILGITILYGFLVSDRKQVYYIAAAVCVAIAAGHVYTCLQLPDGYVSPIQDLTNYVRVVQMPLLAICLITFLRQNEETFAAIQRSLTGVLLMILAVEILCMVTNTDYGTYTDGIGTIGWFSNTNSQSNNLCILVPISLAWQLVQEKRNMPLFWVTAVLSFAALYFFGTRLAYLGIYATCIGLSFTIFLVRRRDWKIAAALLGIAILATALMTYSPMVEHMRVNGGIQNERQGYINMQIGDDLEEVKALIQKVPGNSGNSSSSEEKGMTEEERQQLIEDLTPVYEHYVSDFVEIFGAEKTMEMFNYSIDVHDFSAIRPKKLMFAQMLMNDSPVSSQIFGLNLARFTVGENIYDVENDFHGLYYLYGWVGLGAYLLFLAYFVYLIIWALIKNARKYYTPEAAAYGIAFLMCLAHAYNTAGVIRRPNASIYLSVILAVFYYLVRLKSYDQPAGTRKTEK